MKPILALILAIALGIAAGYGYFSIEAANTSEPFYEGQWAATTSKGDDFAAKLVVSKDFHDFVEMKAHQSYDANFEIMNEGKAVLTFWFAGDPPSDTAINFEKGESTRLVPGKSKSLILTATPTETDVDFRKLLIVNASDPINAPKQLTVIGRVSGGIVADQKIVSLSRKTLDTDNVIQFNIYSFEHDSIRVQDVKFSIEEFSQWAQIEYQNLSSEELASREGAKSGQRATISIDPNLPRNVRQLRLAFTTDAEGYVPIDLTIFIANN